MLVTALLPEPAAAEIGQWSQPIKISIGPDGWWPDVAADNAGNVHAIWNGAYVGPGSNGPDTRQSGSGVSADGANAGVQDLTSVLYYTRWDGTNWTRPTDIGLALDGVALRSSLTVDPAGQVHLIRLGLGRLLPESFGDWSLWHTRTIRKEGESPSFWSTPRRVSRGVRGYFSDIVADGSGTLHAIWTESASGSWGLFYAHSSDGGETWSKRYPLDEGDPVWWYRAQLAIDGLDRLHVVWETIDARREAGSMVGFGTTNTAKYALSSDAGQTWNRTTFASSAASASPQQPAVGVDGRGNILLVYRDDSNGKVFYRVSTDGTRWSWPAPVRGVRAGVQRPYDTYSMATDSAGHVHLVLVGYPGNAQVMSLLHSEWDGNDWLAPTTITNSPPYPEYPRIAIGKGNVLNVVWFAGDRAGIDRVPIGVWYSTARTSAPQVTSRAASGQGLAVTSVLATPTPAGSVQTSRTQQPRPALGGTEVFDNSDPDSGWLATVRGHPDFAIAVGAGAALLAIAIGLAIGSGLWRLLPVSQKHRS